LRSRGGRRLRADPRVCCEVDRLDNMRNWRRVIARGTDEELHGATAARAMRLPTERLAPLPTSETREMPPAHHVASPDAPAPVIFRIRLEDMSGRCERS